MIQLPRRSVTRFFIPLIDVLTLLFCIFLLMPLIKAPGDSQDSLGSTAAPANSGNPVRRPEDDQKGLALTKGEIERLELERQRQEKELEELQREKIKALQERLFIRVLEIDADTGKLFYYESDQRLEIRNQDEALRLIERHQQEAGHRELYYLFLYPRRVTGYPQERQIKQYEGWLKSVAHGRDNPLGSR